VNGAKSGAVTAHMRVRKSHCTRGFWGGGAGGGGKEAGEPAGAVGAADPGEAATFGCG
jgi:hypothetical protein